MTQLLEQSQPRGSSPPSIPAALRARSRNPIDSCRPLADAYQVLTHVGSIVPSRCRSRCHCHPGFARGQWAPPAPATRAFLRCDRSPRSRFTHRRTASTIHREPLIPHLLSTKARPGDRRRRRRWPRRHLSRGRQMAGGRLFIQRHDGKFARARNARSRRTVLNEDVDRCSSTPMGRASGSLRRTAATSSRRTRGAPDAST